VDFLSIKISAIVEPQLKGVTIITNIVPNVPNGKSILNILRFFNLSEEKKFF